MPVRLLVYTDYVYTRDPAGGVFAERAFARFVGGLAGDVETLVVAGRLAPGPVRGHYRLPDGVRFVALPHYTALHDLRGLGRALGGSLARYWRALSDVDRVWLLGPTPLTLVMAVLAWARKRVVILGVRQDLPRYARSRHPGRRGVHLAADALEWASEWLGRRHAVVVVGPELGARYRRSTRLLEVSVSLVGEADIVDADEAVSSGGDEWGRLLSVGRLEEEKNPLLLADVLAALPQRFSLVVCGEGALAGALAARLDELGVAARAELLGYIPVDRGLLEVYRTADAFLHISWTEGLPQVLFEAWAAGLPVVATDVGSVRAVADGAALVVPPGDAEAAARAVRRLADDAELRARLIRAGVARARAHTREAEQARLAAFLTA
jgi:glycosyltransferase involved in cell wall biosynthesis